MADVEKMATTVLESFVSTVGEDEEWEDSGEWGQVGGAPWEVLGVR